MFKEPPPVAVALPLASAIDSLHLAAEAIGVMMTLAENEREAQPIDFDRLDAFRSSCRLFALMFADVMGAIRHGMRDKVCATMRECTEAEPPGLARAVCALKFAIAGIYDALDELDQSEQGREWYGPCVAAGEMLEMILAALELSPAHHNLGDLGRLFFNMN